MWEYKEDNQHKLDTKQYILRHDFRAYNLILNKKQIIVLHNEERFLH